MKKNLAKDKALAIARFAAEKKGEDIVLMDIRTISTMFDYFVVISGTSSRRLKAISDFIQEKLAKKHISPLHVEGDSLSKWILLDYNDVIVHVFHSEAREFYGLERLWSGAKIERFSDKCLKKLRPKK